MGFTPKLYQGATLKDKTANAIITRLVKMKVLENSNEVLAVYGSTTMGAPSDSIVLTRSNIIVIDASGMMLKHSAYPYSGIGSISLVNKGILTYLSLGMKGAGAVNINIPITPDEAKALQDLVLSKISGHDVAPVNSNSTQIDSAAEIERYFVLKEKGILTEEEFQAKKKQLLGL